MEPAYAAVRNLFIPPLRYGLDWTIDGEHLIPRHGPAILAANHVSYLDPLVVGYLVDRRSRRLRFLAKDELFGKRFVGTMLRQMHQIPVARNTGDAVQSLSAAVEAVDAGEVVAIFPEGTISLDLDPMPGKTGAARLAGETGVPVVPVGLWGGHRILFKGRSPNWRRGVAQVVCVGDPVRVGAGDDVREATDRIMEGVCAQVRRARALYPQGPAPGEGDWWVRPPETATLRPTPDRAEEPGAGEATAS